MHSVTLIPDHLPYRKTGRKKDNDSNVTTRVDAKNTKSSNKLAILFLATLSGISAYSFNGALGRAMDGGGPRSVAASSLEMDRKRRLDTKLNERIMKVVKETWPECVKERLSGVECKNFIDEQILRLFTGDDKLARTIIVGKSNKIDEWYNSVVIYMGDDDMVLGRDGNGLIYYDFEWEGSGMLATPEQQSEIPPIIATETKAGSPYADPNDPESDPYSPLYMPLIIEVQPILEVGASVYGARTGVDKKPIGGGVAININIDNTAIGEAVYQAALAAADAAAVEAAGARTIPAFDCSGMTGYSCCLMIKSIVKDADIYGKAIQCHLNFVETTYKAKHFFNHRGKEVHSFTNHNFLVSEVAGS